MKALDFCGFKIPIEFIEEGGKFCSFGWIIGKNSPAASAASIAASISAFRSIASRMEALNMHTFSPVCRPSVFAMRARSVSSFTAASGESSEQHTPT